MLPTVLATRYVAPLREGGSLPGLVEAEDLGTYVMKFRGAGQGLKALVAEVIVGELARRLGIRTPEMKGRPEAQREDRAIRSRPGGPGPAQGQCRAEPRYRFPARLVRLRRGGLQAAG